MFCAADVFLVALWCCIIGAPGLFWGVIHEATLEFNLPELQHIGLELTAKMLPSATIPFSAVFLNLWFRHFIGQQLRRRLERRPPDLAESLLPPPDKGGEA